MLSVMASACPSFVCIELAAHCLLVLISLQYSEAEFLCPCITTISTLHILLGRHKPSRHGWLPVAVWYQAGLWHITHGGISEITMRTPGSLSRPYPVGLE